MKLISLPVPSVLVVRSKSEQACGSKLHIDSATIEAVSSTPLSHLPASDRSDARWMFQNWKDVLNWLEVESGLPVEDPFLMLSNLNHSHPSAIRRKVRLLKENIINDVATNGEVKEVGRIAFERAWKASGTEMEISNPSFEGGEGIWYLVEAYDPFSGSGSAKSK